MPKYFTDRKGALDNPHAIDGDMPSGVRKKPKGLLMGRDIRPRPHNKEMFDNNYEKIFGHKGFKKKELKCVDGVGEIYGPNGKLSGMVIRITRSDIHDGSIEDNK